MYPKIGIQLKLALSGMILFDFMKRRAPFCSASVLSTEDFIMDPEEILFLKKVI